MKILPRDVSVDKEKLTKFWKSNVERILKSTSTLRDTRFFHNLAHISGRDWLYENFYHRCNFEQGSSH